MTGQELHAAQHDADPAIRARARLLAAGAYQRLSYNTMELWRAGRYGPGTSPLVHASMAQRQAGQMMADARLALAALA